MTPSCSSLHRRRARRPRARRRGGIDARGPRRHGAAPLVVAATLGTAAAVAVSGLIGFIGIIVPHFDPPRRWAQLPIVLPLSLLVGGGFLVLADVLARTVAVAGRTPDRRGHGVLRRAVLRESSCATVGASRESPLATCRSSSAARGSSTASRLVEAGEWVTRDRPERGRQEHAPPGRRRACPTTGAVEIGGDDALRSPGASWRAGSRSSRSARAAAGDDGSRVRSARPHAAPRLSRARERPRPRGRRRCTRPARPCRASPTPPRDAERRRAPAGRARASPRAAGADPAPRRADERARHRPRPAGARARRRPARARRG